MSGWVGFKEKPVAIGIHVGDLRCVPRISSIVKVSSLWESAMQNSYLNSGDNNDI
jgi:hypothetical protein